MLRCPRVVPALVIPLIAAVALCGSLRAAPTAAFETVEIDNKVTIGYATAIADVNGDGKPDVLLVDKTQLAWYENPTWTKHVILDGMTTPDNVCIAAADLDGDRKAELALGAYWKPSDTIGSGSVHYLAPPEDRRQPWKLVNLEPEPTVHRMRWADIDGDGKAELLMSPLHGRGNQGPNFEGAGARTIAYRMPKDPASDPWVKEVIDDTLHVVHNLWPVQWDRDPAMEVLLASYEGVHLLDRGAAGKWSRTRLCEGNQQTRPSRGSSEVKLGRLPGGGRYIATVEPWHGNQVVVYTEPPAPGLWTRRVLDENLKEGHGVWCADLNGDGGDELVIGWRGATETRKVGVAAYAPVDKIGERWVVQSIDDGGMACEDLTAGDLNGDGRPDIVAAGRGTKNLRIYFNRKP